MAEVLSFEQVAHLNSVLLQVVSQYTITEDGETLHENAVSNDRLLDIFLSAKQVEGCTTPTIKYYGSTIRQLFKKMPKKVTDYTTEDIRAYLAVFQRKNKSSRVTIDNIRRIFSSFFAWLEEEDYIIKSPVRRIHKVKTGTQVKEVLSDENIEQLRDSCTEIRDLAIIDILASTGMRVGELVKLNREDINFNERECIVSAKGTRNVSFTLMPGQRYICNNTWLLAKTEIRHSLFHWLSRTSVWVFRAWKHVCANLAARLRLYVFILISSGAHWLQWLSTKVCLSNKCNGCLVMSRLTRPCTMLWLIKAT